MKIMLLTIILVSLVISGQCISNVHIKELLLKPTYEFKPIEEIKTKEDAEETLEDISDIGEPEQKEKDTAKLSEKSSISVQDILDY